MPKADDPPDVAERLRLQRELTQEIRQTERAYRDLRKLAPLGEEPPRYRNPHDHAGEYDRLDRKDPAVMPVPRYVLTVPGMLARTRHVPDRAVAEYAEDDTGEFALVECPCGAKPVARATVERCPGCERYYSILDGKRAIVIYGAMTPPGAEPGPEPEPSACELGKCDGSGFIVDELANTSYDCECRPGLIAARRTRS